MRPHADILPRAGSVSSRLTAMTGSALSARSPQFVWLGVAGLFVLAVIVRLVHLSTDPVWFDEAATLGIATMDWHVILGPMAVAESSPPGYYALAKIWSGPFGNGIAEIRMLSVLAGAASVPVIWLIGRRAVSESAGWVAGAFVALAASHVRLSQDARCYAVLFLAASLSILAAQRVIQRVRDGESAWSSSIALGVLIGGMLWLHATAGFITLGLGVMVLVGVLPGRGRFWRAVLWLVVTAVVMAICAAMPLAAIIRHALFSASFIDRWIEPQGLIEVLRLYGRTLIAPFLGPLSPVAAVLQAGLLGAAGWLWWRSGLAIIPALAAMMLVGGLALPLVSLFIPVLLDRTALFLLAPLAVLLGIGAAALPRRLMLPVTVVLLGLQALGVAGWHQLPVRKERWDLAAQSLREKMRPGEPVIMTESAFLEISLASAMRRIGAAPPHVVLVTPPAPMEELAAKALGTTTITADHALSSLMHRTGVVWLVMRDQPTSVDEDPGFTTRADTREALAAGGGRLTERFAVPGVEVERWAVPAQ